MSRVWGAKTADERQAERRERIVRAAVTLYGEQGYHNTSVKAVCVEAGLTERYFYESFANGEDLLRQCFLTVEGGILEKMRSAAADGASSGFERARSALLIYLDVIRSNPATARVFLTEMASIGPAAEALVFASLDRFGGLLMDLLGSDPRFADRPSPLLLRGVVGGGLHIVQAWVASAFRERIEVVAELNLRLYTVLERPGSRSAG